MFESTYSITYVLLHLSITVLHTVVQQNATLLFLE